MIRNVYCCPIIVFFVFMRFMLYTVCKTMRLSVFNKELFDFWLIWNFVEIETDLISGTELSVFDCSCYASQTKQRSVQGTRRSPSTRWYDSLCHTHGFEQNQQSPVMWSETIGLTTRPVWDQKNWSWSWSCRSGVVLWNTVLSRSSS